MLSLLDSITDAQTRHAGSVTVSGSHGGLYPATIASRAGLRAVILNDAGVGLERAGVAGLAALDRCGMAGAAADCMSCDIGSARDMLETGVISVVNAVAQACGIAPGMAVAEAADKLMATAPEPRDRLPIMEEARLETRIVGGTLRVTLLDSASLVTATDAGGVVVTGSHGGLIGGDPARALKAPARIAVFNDAGHGKNAIGTTRLPALERAGIAAVTVAHDTARIGDAASALDTGVISAVNDPATALEARVGMGLAEWLRSLPAMG